MNINKFTSKILTQSSEIFKGKVLQKVDNALEIDGIKPSSMATNPLAPLANDVVQLSATSKFEKMLGANFKKSPVNVSVDGKDYKWSRYDGSQMGSQDAFWARNDETGELFYVKFAQDSEKEGHIISEIQASRLYRLAGLETPDVVPVTINGTTKGLASKYVSDLIEPTGAKALHQGFAADAWLANWDSVLFGNTFVRNGQLVKVDNGGALRYRAQGALKPEFGDKVKELVSLVDGRNPESEFAYRSMTHNELVESFKKVCAIPDKEIQKAVSDKSLAQTLINRKNFMKEVLAEMEQTPKNNEDLAQYFSKITNRITQQKVFNSEVISEKISRILDGKITVSGGNINMPATKTLAKDLIAQVKTLEKKGVNISRENIVNLLKEMTENGVEINSSKYARHLKYICAMEEQYNKMFSTLLTAAGKTAIKDGETGSSYLSRLVKMRERRIKQIDDIRINSIKSKLTYTPENVVGPTKTVLTQSERNKAIAELEAARIKDTYIDVYIIPKLSEDAGDKEIYRAWQKAHIGAFQFSDDALQKAVMGVGGRYNAKHPVKSKSLYETIVEKYYKQEFDIEPVYHWFGAGKPEEFVMKKLPKKGEIYTLQERQCCSTHKHYAEMDYGDHMSSQNIKFIMHPKSETSRAYNLGYHQEVVYPAGEQFRILDKELVEYTDPRTGSGYLRWEVHMQEV